MMSKTTLSELYRPEALNFPKYSLNEKSDLLRLHQNEMLMLSDADRVELVGALSRAIQGTNAFNTYPSLNPKGLLEAFAASLDVNPENIEVTAGSSQALTLIAEALFGTGRTVAITAPSFSLYAHLAHLYGSSVVDISLDQNFEFSAKTLFSDAVMQADVAILCTPNNPTGTVLSHETILEFADQFKGVVVVDEAYFEFFAAQGAKSSIPLATQRNNLIVLRTLSKAWASAGLRLGAMVGHPEVIELFRALKPPYSIAWPSEVLGTFVLNQKKTETAVRVCHTVQQVKELQDSLRTFAGVEKCAQSRANFVFFQTSRAEKVEQRLSEVGFLIRRYSAGRLANCVRISMPPVEQFENLKSILTEVLS